MSRAVLDYSAIEKAGDHAKKASAEMGDYADELARKTARRLDAYPGQNTSNFTTAARLIRQKQQNLEGKSKQLAQYATKLQDLAQGAQASDRAVRSKVSALTQSFADRHGIKISPFAYNMALCAITCDNSNVATRWLSDREQDISDFLLDKGERIEFWYKYEGGKFLIWENIKAALKGAATIAVVIAAVTAFVATPVGVVAFVAGLIGSTFALLDVATDATYNKKAYMAAAKGDPVQAERLNGVNDFTDSLRRGSNNRLVHIGAGALDGLELAAGLVTIVSSAGDLMKKGVKWLTKDPTIDLKTFKLGDIKSTNWKEAARTLGTNIKHNFTLFGERLRLIDVKTLGEATGTAAGKWMANVKGTFTTAYSDLSKLNNITSLDDIAAAANSAKFYLNIPKTLVVDDPGSYFINLGLSGFAFNDADTNKTLASLSDFKVKLLDKGCSILEQGKALLSNLIPSQMENVVQQSGRAKRLAMGAY